MPAPKRSPSLTVQHLKTLLTRIGGPLSGTKPVLEARLRHELSVQRLRKNGKTRVLSVDMGIRNLAFCVCDVEVGSSAGEKKTGAKAGKGVRKRAGEGTEADDVHIEVMAWKRVAVMEAQAAPASSLEDEGDNDTAAALLKLLTPAADDAAEERETFVPSRMARTAYAVLTQLLLPYKPTVILIEQQRYRSQRSAQIQEWTYRVNMLESMLWAVLETLRHERGKGKGGSAAPAITALSTGNEGREGGNSEAEKPRRGRKKKDTLAAEEAQQRQQKEQQQQQQQQQDAFPAVFAVNPKRVGMFWMDTPAGKHAAAMRPRNRRTARTSDPEDEENDDEATARPAKKAGSDRKVEKKDKIALVAHWLQALSEPNAISHSLTPTPSPSSPSSTPPKAPISTAPFPDAGLTLTFTHQAAEMRAAFARRHSRKRRSPQELAPTLAADRDATKLDDLADCLLQVAAWARWEANRRDMAETDGGVIVQALDGELERGGMEDVVGDDDDSEWV